MRAVIGAAILASTVAAQPAFAGAGAAPTSGEPAPLQTIVAAMPAFAAVAPVATDLSAIIGDAAAPAYRLTAALPAVAAAAPLTGRFGDVGLRRRSLGSSMMDYYPFAGSGFHLSGGPRLFARRNFAQETENSARGALAGARSIMAPIATRAGFRRFNPALTAGYTLAVSHLAQIGVEGGALMGRAFAGTPGLPRDARGYRNDNAVRPDAIANLVFGMRF